MTHYFNGVFSRSKKTNEGTCSCHMQDSKVLNFVQCYFTIPVLSRPFILLAEEGGGGGIGS